VKASALDLVAETEDAVAFRINGRATGNGRSAVVYFSPILTRSAAANLLRSVAAEMDTSASDPEPEKG
jgi:hypothetical protein